MRLARDELEVGRCVRERRARRREQLAHRLIERPLLLKLLAQPTTEHRRALLLHRLRIDLQHVGPHRRLQRRELRSLQQLIDEPRALVRLRIGDELAHCGWRRQRAEQVDMDATHELLVGARRSTLRSRCDQRLAHMRIDRPAFGLLRERECCRVLVHAHARDRCEAREAREHDRFAAARRFEHAVLDARSAFVARRPRRATRDVRVGSIRVVRAHREWQPRADAGQRRVLRHHFDRHDCGRRRAIIGSALLDPLDDASVVGIANLHALAALMRDRRRGLLQQEALLWHMQIDAATAQLARDGAMVAIRVVAKQREQEPVLAHRRAVAAARVAAARRQRRHHFVAEARKRR